MPRVRMVPPDDGVDGAPLGGGIGDAELEAAGLLHEGEQLPNSAPPSEPAPNRGAVRRRATGDRDPEVGIQPEEEEIIPAAEAAPSGEGQTFEPQKILFGMNRHAMARHRLLQANAKILAGVRLSSEIKRVQDDMDPEQRELKKMRELFDTMDEDGSGALSQSEIQTLVRSMGDRMSTAQIMTAMTKMDPEMNGEVTFERFVKWWRYKKQEYRRDLAKRVEDVFKVVDADGSGQLEKSEVKQIYSKVLKSLPGTIEFFPPFDLNEDFELMQARDLRSLARKQEVERLTTAENNGEIVNYDEFVAWFKFRTGDEDPTLPVLPEYICSKIDNLSQQEKEEQRPDKQDKSLQRTKSGRHFKRSGKELWAFLRPRLRLLVQLQHQWGSMHEVYGSHNVSLFENTQVPVDIRDPDSKFSEWWDMAQVTFLLYVAYAVPSRTAFDIDTPLDNAWFYVDVVVDVYFIADCFLSFRTAYWAKNGVLEVSKRAIAEHYLKSWFVLDFISSIPINYVMLLFLGQERAAKYRILRMFRLFRLLRLARIKRLVQRYQDSFDLGPYLGLLGTLATILFAAHAMACGWYFMGTSSVAREDGDGNPVYECMDGTWSHTCAGTTFDLDADGQKITPVIYGWAQTDKLFGGFDDPKGYYTEEQLNNVALGTRYIRSMFVIFQKEFGPGTSTENFFAVMSELVVGFIYGGLAGVISSLMMSSSAGEQEYVQKMVALKSWMKSKKMTKRHRMKILAHFNTQQENGTFFAEEDILASLPPTLSSELSFYMYRDMIEKLPLFKGLGQEVIHHLCQIVRPMRALKDQVIYEEGSIGTTMYVIIDGEVEVSLGGERLGFLSKGAFFGETPLIEIVTEKGGDGTEVRARSIAAVIDTNLGYVESNDLGDILYKYPELKIRLAAFEKVGKKLGDKGNNKCEMAKMKVASLMVAAKNAHSDGTLVRPNRYEEAAKLTEDATVAMEEARRRGTNDDYALQVWGHANRALEDALGITLRKQNLIKCINSARQASGRKDLAEEDLLPLPLRTIEKEAVDAGVDQERIDAAAQVSAAERLGDDEGPDPEPVPTAEVRRGRKGDDNTEILRLLRDMKTTQDKLVADVQALKNSRSG